MENVFKCYTCKKIKELSYFPKNKTEKNGITGRCKDCKDDYYNKLKLVVYPENFVKECYNCNEKKLLKDFYNKIHGKYCRDNFCKKCRREDVEKNKSKNKNTELKRVYNISLEEYNNILKIQNNVCAICQNPEFSKDALSGKERLLSVDHCHSTGKVRGLLCNKCNRGLGFFQDNEILLVKAAEYLKKLTR